MGRERRVENMRDKGNINHRRVILLADSPLLDGHFGSFNVGKVLDSDEELRGRGDPPGWTSPQSNGAGG